VAILGMANFVVARRNHTWDLTNKKIYSLSPQTVSLLKSLKEPVKVVSFGEGVPEPVENLLKRYGTETDKLTWEFRDPRRDPEAAAKYEIREGQPATVLIAGKLEAERRVKVSIAKIASAALGEQELTNGLLKLTTTGAQKLYFVQGHEEVPLQPLGQGEEAVATSLSMLKRILEEEGYEALPVNLVERGEVPLDAAALVVAGPRTRFTEREVFLIDGYLDQGGRMLYFAEQGAALGLEKVLAKHGVQIEPGLVADAKLQPENPYVVLTPFFGEHEIVKRLSEAKTTAVFPTVRALTQLREGVAAGVNVAPLVFSSPYAWIETTLDREPELSSGETAGQLTLALAVSRDTKTAERRRFDEAKLVVFGDTDALSTALTYDRNLILNAFAWVTQQGQKITIRPPDRDVSTLDITPEMFAAIRLLSLDVLPMLLMAVGLTIWVTRRAR
jgi:ABC-type uncharacterized transport system involved in gliding motility auxiliary subunit